MNVNLYYSPHRILVHTIGKHTVLTSLRIRCFLRCSD